MVNTVAERQLLLKSANRELKVLVKLGQPVLDSTGQDWECPYEVQCGEYLKSRKAHGVDAMQALQLALAILDDEIRTLRDQVGGELYQYNAPFRSILQLGGLEVVNEPRASG